MHAGEEDHARPRWTTSRRGQDSPWKSQSEKKQRTEINGESTSMVWPTLGSRTAKKQNRTPIILAASRIAKADHGILHGVVVVVLLRNHGLLFQRLITLPRFSTDAKSLSDTNRKS